MNIVMETVNNPQLQMATDFVQFTDLNIFLTGKAGTGKTTFLKNLKQNSPKRMIVVAPTGVAALNAGGVTIHSFFQLPFGPHIPVDMNQRSPSGLSNPFKFSREKINIIKSMDLLVIDEISMVRADLLDGIDSVLRKFRDRGKPFGGVQLLMIGDLQQLAPVIKDDEWDILKAYYETGYFFSSRALQKTRTVNIELKHIYRQSDTTFIQLLNKIRENKPDPEVLHTLNQRCIPLNELAGREGYITLTTHNAQAQKLNTENLNQLPSQAYTFKASLHGEFPEYSYPTDFNLTLKKGAQVMFVKNDNSPEKLFYNGKIGKITDIDDEMIYVVCNDEENEIPVERMEWQNLKYSIDEQTKEIREEVAGKFIQYPLRLAWAITIHKSQGLTFEKAIIDARAAFTHGQVYVALSRCKSLEGIVLSSPIGATSIKNDTTVTSFTQEIEQNIPSQAFFEESRIIYQQSLISELFDFRIFSERISSCIKLCKEHQASVSETELKFFQNIQNQYNTEIKQVVEKFRSQIGQLNLKQPDIQKNQHLQERIQKGCSYFTQKTETLFLREISSHTLDIDNRAILKVIHEAAKKLLEEVTLKHSCLNECSNGFSIRTYLNAKSRASIFKPKLKPSKSAFESDAPASSAHEDLYRLIRNWRDETAAAMDLPVYMILPQKTMRELATNMPLTKKELVKTKGMGRKKMDRFGEEILQIVSDYYTSRNPGVSILDSSEQDEEDIPKPEKKHTRIKSFELFTQGKNIQEIATARGLAVSTIESHLAHFVRSGKIDIHRLITEEKLMQIAEYFKNHDRDRLSPAKEALGDAISWGELRFAVNYLNFNDSKNTGAQ